MARLKNRLKSICLAIAIIASAGNFMAAQSWIPLRTETTATKTIMKDTDTEVLTLPSVIMLNISQTSKVEVFTILGRLLSSETLHPGSYEFQVEAHGIYIVKIGDLTCKVAI